MLCLDMKLVSRLRGTAASATNTSPTTSVVSPSSGSTERNKSQKARRESGDAIPITISDSEEELLRPGSSVQEMNRRSRSRSVCVTTILPSSQLRQLHRRASHVSTTDAITRRGVLSRRCYGSVEMLPQIEQDGADNGRRFRVENGDSPGEKEEMFGSPSTPILENPEYQTRWYFKYFLGKLHQNYIASDQERNPLFLSVVTSEVGDQCVPHYRVILWRRTGAQKISLPYSANKTMTIRQILSNFFGLEKLDKAPREVFTPELQKDLLLLEEQEGSVNFKFGVIYAREGQTTDDEMLSNERGSPGFETFLEILGERIRLKGWDKYRGGLDVKGDMTGKESYYTVYAGHEVMYHVSTMLPYSKDNPQQLERKRHIGNDIVNIIYADDPSTVDTFNPNCIRSQFTHVFAVVTTEANGKGWRVAIYCDDNVPLFGPSLPCPPVFEDPYNLREFLLVKLINGEKATFDTPTFSRKRERTLDALLRDMYQEHSQESKSNSMLNRRALSDVVEAPGRRREETRAVEMVRVGQALKLEAIMRGLAPTSLATVGPLKPRPWEPRCIYPDFPHEVVCGDVWLENRLILASENGTFLIEDGLSHRLIFDESVQIKQLDVVEQHGILLFRASDKGKENSVYVFRLREFESDASARCAELFNDRESEETREKEENDVDDEDAEDDDDDCEEDDADECDNFTRATARFQPVTRSRARTRVRAPAVRSRAHIKERKLRRTRGCHLYSITRPGGSHLRMCVVVGRRLTVLQWKHNAAWTIWCSSADTDTVDGFLPLKEFTASETPTLVTMIESTDPTNEWTLCCGARHHFELISACGVSRIIHLEASPKPNLVAALDLREDEEPELLLCYNNTCHFQKLMEENAAPTEFDFNWNSIPIAVACAFPYVIAFTSDTMEIRLIINGNLVHTIAMPNISLITSKRDIFFATTAPEFFPGKCERIRLDSKPLEKEEMPCSPPPTGQSSSSSRSIFQNSQGDWKPIRIYRIPLQTLSRNAGSNCSQRRCPSPAEPEIVSAPPTTDRTFLNVEPQRAFSRSCSSSPTPTPTTNLPSSCSK
ncbi:GTPase-activating Rap/Ran-GAP domain-like protein 3 isoform X1 [Cataglyphis hispanica]|uniref:GTPase-activating Rap/Ran-GAP domain-like protein 3 isoform X1 n=1 Tax=Cataglyphis hispanica TaxID=1086592 RepID=UPI0021807151|nr:GTPase-activating Rap/Ran-GAP domain-like protein 3 isoform X1 [Cataglyphis hispanica]XP_050459387.1 GTPase-activating Rap/Ran-GAP domain-like protein 3 isoform X1 [Cataglyphis hispanica]XP_050459394.1 GTPase-activating Rap/Ran-GAP domain-like protein 3 isoform X1 [Cataglyphis hispanica]XP_050459395.1 GTPase-activating Rap/Ran-GAP domain-like protein 3 isoform X1 [Cataglyphis hispanica]XP_050459400.1 GTPase-activating Rap/Ran-GAP domain-like protein 3 isoform X1 [Cataglyphis hispanica]XP_05